MREEKREEKEKKKTYEDGREGKGESITTEKPEEEKRGRTRNEKRKEGKTRKTRIGEGVRGWDLGVTGDKGSRSRGTELRNVDQDERSHILAHQISVSQGLLL